MRFGDWALAGFVGTVVLTTLMAVSQGLGLTRMDLPFMLGTLFTADRERAKLFGIGVHLLNGWVFALVYALAFEQWGAAGPLRGAVAGFIHGAFVLAVVMPALPGFHHRMASEHEGPVARRQLEPPGFLGLHYGYQTPVSVMVAHVVYGVILGVLYRI